MFQRRLSDGARCCSQNGLAKWATLEKAVILKKKKLYPKGLELLTALAEELDEVLLCNIFSSNSL